MGEYYEVSCRLELATEEKDEPRLLETAQRMLETIETIGSFRNSPLYSHINFKNMDPDWLAEMKKGLLGSTDKMTIFQPRVSQGTYCATLLPE